MGKRYRTLNIADIIKLSNIKNILLSNHLKYVFGWLHSQDSQRLKWLMNFFKKNNFIPLTVDFKLQEDFEHKIFFDNFLKKNNLSKPESETYKYGSKLPSLKDKIVIQYPQAAGGEETFILKNVLDIKSLQSRGLIRAGQRYLVRKFINGQSYGSTLIISQNEIILSAIRRQCYQKNTFSNRMIFNGVQWLPTDYFSKKAQANINDVFLKLGKALANIGYRGIANIDFIIEDNSEDVYIIECNPRLSSSTKHVFAFPSLISDNLLGQLLFDIYNKIPTNSQRNYKFTKMPKVGFVGATIDINGFHLTKKNEFVIRKEYSPGLYSLKSNKISFISPDIRLIPNDGKYFIISSFASKNEIYKWNDVVCSLMTNFQLYDFNTGILNKEGVKLLKYFNYC